MKAISQIDSQMLSLGESLERIYAAKNEIRRRLEPTLRPEPQPSGLEPGDERVLCPLAERLRSMQQYAAQIEYDLADVIARLEV